jgi:hypothetical protein
MNRSVTVDLDAVFADRDLDPVRAAGAFGKVLDAERHGCGDQHSDDQVQEIVG